MKTIQALIGATLIPALLSFGAHANLINNGGFEDIGSNTALGGYGSPSTWQIYSAIEEWDASQNIEIWTNDFIVPAYEGSNVLELNAHPANANGAFSIYQSFATQVGQQYELTFAGRKREQRSDEAFSVAVGDLNQSIFNQAWGVWNEYSFTFTALASTSTLTFTSLDGGSDTTGNVFDAVRIVAVPEPATLALLVMGLTGLVVYRARKN